MLSKLFTTFVFVLVTVQAVVALPTRGSYGQLARRASASKIAKRSGPSATPAALKKRASLQYKAPTAKQTSTETKEKRDATIASYVSQLTRHQAEDAHIVAALSSSAPTFAPTAIPLYNPKIDIAAASKSVGGQFGEFASAAGVHASFVPTGSASPSLSAPFVSATNVTLPTAAAAKKAMNQKENPKQYLLNKRVVSHPGEPDSATVKIDVVGGPSMETM